MWTRPIILLGVISFFADVASDMLYPIWPMYLTQVLGASVIALGATEGLAELIAGLVKLWAGRLSDQSGRRKVFVFFGYLMAAFAKPLTGFSSHWLQALLGKGFDRFGKGVRTAPRDALLADWAPAGQEGKVFGFHRGMDSAGATLGPLITLGLMAIWPAMALSKLFFLAFIPGLVAAFLVLWVPEKAKEESEIVRTPFFASLSKFPMRFYFFLTVWIVFSVANSSDVFLLLQIQQKGATSTQVILSYCLFNLTFAVLSYPLGAWADRKGARFVFNAGLFIFSLVYLIFAAATVWWQLIAGLFLYGVFAAATDGVGKAMILAVTPKDQKATAIGLFVGVTGISTLIASVLCGWIWETYGSTWSFAVSAGVAFSAALLLLLERRTVESA